MKSNISIYASERFYNRPVFILVTMFIMMFVIIYFSTQYDIYKHMSEAKKRCGDEPTIIVEYKESIPLLGGYESPYKEVYTPKNSQYTKVINSIKNPFKRYRMTITGYFCSIDEAGESTRGGDGPYNQQFYNIRNPDDNY